MSRQAKRACCYRDCTSTNDKSDRTLFQFPKDEERAQKWIELGRVDTSVSGPKFMCDLHFSRIYMCFSARRKMLLNTAIPVAYGMTTEDEQQQQHEGDSVTEHVGSSTTQGEHTLEEHLDGTDYEVLESDENHMTEIIYMDDLQQLEQEPEPEVRSPKARIIKVEKLPAVVAPSSTTPAIPTLGSPQQNIILRKVKLKKRPSTGAAGPVSAKKVKQDIESPVETTVSSSPEKVTTSPRTVKKVQVVKVIPSSTAEQSKPPAAKPVKTPASPAKPLRATIMEKRKDVINEFIFKGEEYIQLPKEAYLQDLDDMDQELQRNRLKYGGEVEELEQLLEASKAEIDQCVAEKEHYRVENELLAKKVEEYRMVIKNMKDVLNIFHSEDED